MSDPNAPRRINVTLKHPESKRYAGDNPWITVEGSVEAVREQIIQAFGMSDTDGLSLAELVSEAQSQFTAIANAKAGLGGGKILSSGPSSSGGNAWDNVGKGEAQADEPEENPILTAIGNCQTVADLKQLWAENQDAFNDEALMSMWKARGKAIQGASA